MCRDVDAIYLNNRDFSDLPRAVRTSASAEPKTIRLTTGRRISVFLAAHNSDGDIGFRFSWGTQGQNPRLAWHLPVFVYPNQVVPLTTTIIELFRAKGSRGKNAATRGCGFWSDIGISGVQWLEERLPFRLEPSIAEPIPSSTPEENSSAGIVKRTRSGGRWGFRCRWGE
ncbi:MAG: hypothetical protein R3C49_27295 [Planctomycetaceae bacterium]